MLARIEVASKVYDSRASVRKQKFSDFPFFKKITSLSLLDAYTIDKSLSSTQIVQIASALSNPVSQKFFIQFPEKNNETYYPDFTWSIEIGFLPGVTDNIATTVKETIEDLLQTKFINDENVYTSQITFIKGNLTKTEIKQIADSLYNPLIQRAYIKGYKEFHKNNLDIKIPKVSIVKNPEVIDVNLQVSDDELTNIGKLGIQDKDGTRRGPLALSLISMKTIQKYFTKLRRNPTDIELEALAQTWSEHCKHTIFNSPIDSNAEGLFTKYIRKATDKIREKKGKKDNCVSVFTDNSGAISFDEKFLITYKVETHNSPSALDPFGGAITGIVGVNRDAIGFGLGAKPVANTYGFCFASPQDTTPIYRDSSLTQKMLSPKRIMEGVIAGVNSGGNCSGIPTPQGFVCFNDRYKGKPLVFVGTVGLIPKKIHKKESYIKKAMPGDYIVMVGGRVGLDGIHGATFSSEALNSSSPISAVQIGDPITQKKLSDALIKEARDMNLFTSITDNGAGGLSCSVAEMAKESNGCFVMLDKVPLKYAGLSPWQIWISESQERMTLAVPKDKWKEFVKLMQKRDIEATVIGEFTDSGKCIVSYCGKVIMDIDLKFLHDGLPQIHLKTASKNKQYEEPHISILKDYTDVLHGMMKRLNLASYEFISAQYDYEVQGTSVIKPLQGRGRINGEATTFRPILSSNKGIVLSQGIYPEYSDIDTYQMAACAVDTAVRNSIAQGANPNTIAILDNFCWCSSKNLERLGELKKAVQACYAIATAYGTPFISGKDSMFNDFNGFDMNGKPLKISIPPTLLISSIGIIDDVTKAVSLDAKFPGDIVYIMGETFGELGASEYYRYIGELKHKVYIGNKIPNVNANKNKLLYNALAHAIRRNLIASAQSIGKGGLAVALAKTAMGGMLGMHISLTHLPGKYKREDIALFSETQGRVIVTVSPENKEEFEKMMKNIPFAQVGIVLGNESFTITDKNKNSLIKTDINRLLTLYKETFAEY